MDPIADLLSAQLAAVMKERDEWRERAFSAGDKEGNLRMVLAAEEGAHMDTKRQVATARSEGWRAGVDAAARVARSTGRYSKADAEVCDEIAGAIAGLTETKGKDP